MSTLQSIEREIASLETTQRHINESRRDMEVHRAHRCSVFAVDVDIVGSEATMTWRIQDPLDYAMSPGWVWFRLEGFRELVGSGKDPVQVVTLPRARSMESRSIARFKWE